VQTPVLLRLSWATEGLIAVSFSNFERTPGRKALSDPQRQVFSGVMAELPVLQFVFLIKGAGVARTYLDLLTDCDPGGLVQEAGISLNVKTTHLPPLFAGESGTSPVLFSRERQ